MERQIDSEILKLKERILLMGGYVEKALEESTQALINREPERFKQVYQFEKTINRSHIEVDEASLKILATQSPLAADLRLIVAVIKINTDLERMGDQAVNIAENGVRYLSEPPLKPLIDLPQMAHEVRFMVRESLDAFVKQDLDRAADVLNRDDSVDELKRKIFSDLKVLMRENSANVDRAMTLILIARNLERLGDHATNIAEDVIFAATGRDIRHSKSV